jgi:DNA-binding NarL/FixJ family response regulator
LAEPRIRVLVVDDHRMFAQSLVRILADESDIEVVGVASTVNEARAVASCQPADVVLLDYELPDATGTEAVASLRESMPEAQFVVLTGRTDTDALAAAVEAGCCGFVTKDKCADELMRAVRAASANEAVIPPAMLAQLLPRLRRAQRHTGSTELTPRETEILDLLAQGWSTDSIAQELVLSRHTVRNHVQRVLTKLGAHSKLEAVALATRTGLIRRSTASPTR